MKSRYYLNGTDLPVIPTPHDCVIEEIRLEGQNLIFIFDSHISDYDSVKYYYPNAKSLIITFYLNNNIYDISLLQRKGHVLNRFFHELGTYKEIDIIKQPAKLINLTKTKLKYLYHNVGYCSIIVKLFSTDFIIMDLSADFVDFEWIE